MSELSQKIDRLYAAFGDVTRPSDVVGDDYASDLFTAELKALVAGDQRRLTLNNFQRYIGNDICTRSNDLLFLLPTLLRLWADDIRNTESWFVPHLYYALSNFGNERSRFLYSYVAPDLRAAAIDFMNFVLVRTIGRGSTIPVTKRADLPLYFGDVVSYGAIADDIASVWNVVWSATTEHHAIAVVQYASLLICDNSTNPVFAKSAVMNEPAKKYLQTMLWGGRAVFTHQPWLQSNVAYLRSVLNVELLRDSLERAKRVLTAPQGEIVRELLDRLAGNIAVALDRCRLVPEALSKPASATATWDDVRRGS
jgi:hypothetical protein